MKNAILATLTELVQGSCLASQKYIISQNVGAMITRVFSASRPVTASSDNPSRPASSAFCLSTSIGLLSETT